MMTLSSYIFIRSVVVGLGLSNTCLSPGYGLLFSSIPVVLQHPCFSMVYEGLFPYLFCNPFVGMSWEVAQFFLILDDHKVFNSFATIMVSQALRLGYYWYTGGVIW